MFSCNYLASRYLLNYVSLAEFANHHGHTCTHKVIHIYALCYTQGVHQHTFCVRRGQLEFVFSKESVDLTDVEDAASIVKRFATGQSV